MITEDKVTEIFCMADDSCKFFDTINGGKIYAKAYWKKKVSSRFHNVKGRSHANNDSFSRLWLSLL